MLRYCAFSWNNSEPERREHALRMHQLLSASGTWNTLLHEPGLIVCHFGNDPAAANVCRLANRRGVILGTLFDKRGESYVRRTSLDERETEDILSTEGRDLIHNYWGSYVAFGSDSQTGTSWILRDPTGAVPCFLTPHRGVSVLFSDMDDAVQLGIAFVINWEYVAAHLTSSDMMECARTGLREISILLAGECVRMRGNEQKKSFHWDPVRIATTDGIHDGSQAVEQTRGTVRACVNAWASTHSHILHQFSGGLDSSIVLACLRSMPSAPQVTCLNLHSEGADGDERGYARLVAQSLGYELLEAPRDPSLRMEPLLDMARAARPSPRSWMYSLLFGRSITSLARQRGATAITSGEFGDQIFYQNPAMPAAIDYVRQHGLRGRFASVALDVARLEAVSIWKVIHRAILYGAIRKPRWSAGVREILGRRERPPSELLARDISASPRPTHPWFAGDPDAPIGKLVQISQLIHPFMFDNAFPQSGDPDYVHPLYSQPLIELALRIPLHLCIEGAWGRAVARRAFASELPTRVITRRTKGGREEYIKQILTNNLPFMREMLLDGALAREGLLDRRLLEKTLSGHPTDRSSLLFDLRWILCTEIWVRQWHSSSLGSKVAA